MRKRWILGCFPPPLRPGSKAKIRWREAGKREGGKDRRREREREGVRRRGCRMKGGIEGTIGREVEDRTGRGGIGFNKVRAIVKKAWK